MCLYQRYLSSKIEQLFEVLDGIEEQPETINNIINKKLVLIIQEAVEKLPNALPAIKTNVGEFVEVKFNLPFKLNHE